MELQALQRSLQDFHKHKGQLVATSPLIMENAIALKKKLALTFPMTIDNGNSVFVNKTGTAAGKTAPEFGTIVVKENLGNDNKLKALTVMYKVEGFNPKKGDWFWVKYSLKGKVANTDKKNRASTQAGIHFVIFSYRTVVSRLPCGARMVIRYMSGKIHDQNLNSRRYIQCLV